MTTKLAEIWRRQQMVEAQAPLQAELERNARQHGYTNDRMNVAVRMCLRQHKLPMAEQAGYAVALTQAQVERIQKQFPHFPPLAAAATVLIDRGQGQASAYVIGYKADGAPAVASILSPARSANLEDKITLAAAKARIELMQSILQENGARVALAQGRTYTPAGTKNKPKTSL